MRKCLVKTAGAIASTSTSAQTGRSFSSTASTSSFLFRRPPPPDAQKLFAELTAAKAADRLDLIGKIYPKFRDAVQTTPLSESQHGRFTGLMAFVAKTGNVTLLRRMFADLPMMGLEADRGDHHALLRGLSKGAQSTMALRWIESMEDTYGVSPTVDDWNLVVNGFRKEGDLEGMWKVLASMKAKGSQPDVWTYNKFIAALLAEGDVAGARQLRQEMDDVGVVADTVTDVTLLDGFLHAGEQLSASQVRARLDSTIDGWLLKPPEEVDVSVLNASLKHECTTKGFAAGFELVQRYRSQGFSLDGHTFSTLAKFGVSQVDDAELGIALVESLEQALDTSASTEAWTIVETRLLQTDRMEEALKIYREARDRSIQPDAQMVQPLLAALFLPSPTPAAFEIAKSLYDDLLSSPRAYGSGPDAVVFNTLLRACADPTHPDFDFSSRLTADMRDRRIVPDGSTLTQQIVAHMRAASTFEQAFQAYDTLRAVHVDALETYDYNAILAAFTSLPLQPSPNLPLPSLYIKDILADMRKTQNPLDSVTYSLLLAYFSRLEDPSLSSVRQIHSLIKVDSNLDPDLPLFNSLMTAYSRVRAFSAALRVWDSMRSMRGVGKFGNVDETSVSVVLDTCGWASKPEGIVRGRQIWAELVAEGFPLNAKNYETWVECLCRQGDLAGAEEVVFGRESEATVGMAEIYLKMARRDGKVAECENMLERLGEELPQLLPLLPSRLRRPDY